MTRVTVTPKGITTVQTQYVVCVDGQPIVDGAYTSACNAQAAAERIQEALDESQATQSPVEHRARIAALLEVGE